MKLYLFVLMCNKIKYMSNIPINVHILTLINRLIYAIKHSTYYNDTNIK